MLYDSEQCLDVEQDPVDFNEFLKLLWDNSDNTSKQSDDGTNQDLQREKKQKFISSLSVSHYQSSRNRTTKIPRFFVHDIRKCYTRMFQNILNSGDLTLLFGFFETYCAGSPQNITTKYLKGVPEKMFTMNVHGLREVAKYWYCIMTLSPDSVCSLSEASFQYTTGDIITYFHGEGTHIYVDPPQAASYYAPYIWADEKYNKEDTCIRRRHNEFIVGRPDDRRIEDDANAVERKKKVMREIMSSVQSVVSHLPLRNPPLYVGADGKLVFSTDENKRITKIEFEIYF